MNLIRKYTIYVALFCSVFVSRPARADFWGGDIPLLLQIITNTLNTLHELQHQSDLLKKELRGIDDKIHRIQAIKELLNPQDKERWKDPVDALKRLQTIYTLLPDQFKTQKSKEVEEQLAQALVLAEQLKRASAPAYESGRELEKKALDSGPAVSQKLAASGIGTLVTLEAQNQVAQGTIINLLSQMIAEGASKDASLASSQAKEMKQMSGGLSGMANAIRAGSGGAK